MQCIACGKYAERTSIRGDIEAAFCDQHLPREIRELVFTIHIRY